MLSKSFLKFKDSIGILENRHLGGFYMSEEKAEYRVEKISNRKRQKQIVIRATDKEFEEIKKKVEKSKLTQNKYLLQSALDKEINVVEGIKDLVLETKRIGINLNQLTKLANQGKVDCSDELERINQELIKTWKTLRDLTQAQL